MSTTETEARKDDIDSAARAIMAGGRYAYVGRRWTKDSGWRCLWPDGHWRSIFHSHEEKMLRPFEVAFAWLTKHSDFRHPRDAKAVVKLAQEYCRHPDDPAEFELPIDRVVLDPTPMVLVPDIRQYSDSPHRRVEWYSDAAEALLDNFNGFSIWLNPFRHDGDAPDDWPLWPTHPTGGSVALQPRPQGGGPWVTGPLRVWGDSRFPARLIGMLRHAGIDETDCPSQLRKDGTLTARAEERLMKEMIYRYCDDMVDALETGKLRRWHHKMTW